MKNRKIIILLLAVILLIGSFVVLPSADISADAITVGKTTSYTVSSTYDGKINMYWARVSNVSGYQIFRATSSSGPYTKIKAIKSPTITSYNDTTVTIGKTYYYKMRSYKQIGTSYYFSGCTNPRKVTAKVTLGKPATFSFVKKTSSSIAMKWGSVSGVDGYKVYRATSYSGTYSLIKTISGKSNVTFTNTGLKSSKTYYYKVRTYKVINGKYYYGKYTGIKTASTTVSLSSKWSGRMKIPTSTQINSLNARLRSPYITFVPSMSTSNSAFADYSVDFRADYLPKGTYLATTNFATDVSDLNSRYQSVYNDYGGNSGIGYCGFQKLSDGSTLAIMSLWSVNCRDYNGKVTKVQPKLLYPSASSAIRYGTFGNEGTGIQCMVKFDFKAGHSYRSLLQTGVSSSTGNMTIEFWVEDLATGMWTKLIVYDTGLKNSYLYSPASFLEDFDLTTAGSVRTMELYNIRYRACNESSWTPVLSGRFTANADAENFSYSGSYNFGATDNKFWAITSGVMGLVSTPTRTTFSVTSAATGSPF